MDKQEFLNQLEQALIANGVSQSKADKYLKKFENMNISLFPKEDMYYILQNYESQIYFAERKIREEAFKMVLEELSQDKYLGNFMG